MEICIRKKVSVGLFRSDLSADKPNSFGTGSNLEIEVCFKSSPGTELEDLKAWRSKVDEIHESLDHVHLELDHAELKKSGMGEHDLLIWIQNRLQSPHLTRVRLITDQNYAVVSGSSSIPRM